MGVLDHLKLSFFHLLSFQLSLVQLSTLFIPAFWSRAGPPQGPKSPKVPPLPPSRGQSVAFERSSQRFFWFFEPLVGYQKRLFFSHLSKTPQIYKIIDDFAPEHQCWTKKNGFRRPFFHSFFVFRKRGQNGRPMAVWGPVQQMFFFVICRSRVICTKSRVVEQQNGRTKLK